MPARNLIEGRVVEGFTVEKKLHVGGMAVLWQVSHPDHPRPLVMKVPRLAEGEDPAAIVSFEMEQMIMPRLSGPHVPRFIANGGFDTQPYLIMEMIEGPSLLAESEAAPLPPARVAEIGAMVAEALDSLHGQHVVHLDVKPANILLRDGMAVLVDFGLSHHTELPDLMGEEFRLPYGTAPYMAPEQIMRLRSEARSDLFALGAMLYMLVTGLTPFGNPQRIGALQKRLWWDPHPPRELRPECPEWLQEIILRCLEVQPERRYPTAAQLAFDLRHPDQVPLTLRAKKLQRDSWTARIRRRFHPDHKPRFTRNAGAVAGISTAPIVVVAVDVTDQENALGAALRSTLSNILATLPKARIACVNVLRHNIISLDTTLDEQGRNKHVQRLVELQHWAAPLKLPEGRITFHVLEGTSPASVILDYARLNRVDHIVLGARTASFKRKVLGSVSGEVAAEAPCNVTVVRLRNPGASEG